MKLKFAYQRVSGTTVDISVVTEVTATIGDIAEEIVACDPARSSVHSGTITLSAGPPGSTELRLLDPARPIGETEIASGWTVRVMPWAGAAPRHAGPRVEMIIEGESGQGRRLKLNLGSHLIGRDSACDVVLSDPLVSKRHARLEIGDTVELVDLNSANGILVDGGLVPRLRIADDQSVVLGDSTVTFRVHTSSAEARDAIVAAAIPFIRSPQVGRRYPGRKFASPDIPNELEKQPFPWLVLLAPLVGGALIYFFTQSLISLTFMGLSPLMMIGNYLSGRKQRTRRRDSEVGRFHAQHDALREELAAEVRLERSIRQSEVPDLQVIHEAVLSRGALLWCRRPEHSTFLKVRLGTGRVRSRNRIEPHDDSRGLPEFADQVKELTNEFESIDDVPIVEDPFSAGALGIVGSHPDSCAAARGLLAQWIGLHSPAELVVAALVGPEDVADFGWLKWVPHTSSVFSPLTGSHLASSAASVMELLGQLEGIVGERGGEGAGSEGVILSALADDPDPIKASLGGEDANSNLPPLPIVVVLMTANAPVDRGRAVQILERGSAVGIVPVYVSERRTALPAACRTFIEVGSSSESATVHFVRHGVSVANVAAIGMSVAEAYEFAVQMAPVVDAGAVAADSSNLPRTVPLLALLGPETAATSSGVVDRWTENQSLNGREESSSSVRTPTLRALVGQSGQDALHLDLRTQGPHALVGGTTGAGKSEFLQAWILGMAVEYSPDRLAFLFVDYKGGAAFAECVNLPHCVGLVTDLSPHLVRRALTSLRAELRHREHILNRKKAKDLIELESRRDPDCPPALVLVIDEFAALVSEVPEFVDGVVDIAQRGRSLGIHLIMATQRPAGVIKDNLRANTNLRVALRMADEADSTDVVGVPDAALFDPAIPGRALAKTGPGRLVQFQSGFAGGWTGQGAIKPTVSVYELRFGAETRWEPPRAEHNVEVDTGPNDLVRVVESIAHAAESAAVPKPRRPWLDQLEAVYDLADLKPVTDSELVLGMGDLPASQQQTPVYFRPDVDGHLIVYGTGGSGKSVTLRTLAASAGATRRGGPVSVYGIDFGSGGLHMLEVLPHVGSVIAGEDGERIVRLFRMLKAELERRGRIFAASHADSVSNYRVLAGSPDEPRILVLLDGFPAFRAEYESAVGRSRWYGVFQQILTDGRQLGIHVVLTADRPGSVPSQVASNVPRRVVLRMAEEAMYSVLAVPKDVLGSDSPPGRAIVDGVETQVAVLGGQPTVSEQSRAMEQFARAMRRAGGHTVTPVAALPTKLAQSELPDAVDGQPVLGISDDTLEPVGFGPAGAFVLGGGPGSGRTNGLLVLSRSLARWNPSARMHYFAVRRSPLAAAVEWTSATVGLEASADNARRLTEEVSAAGVGDSAVVVVVEALDDFFSTPADPVLVELFKAVTRCDGLVIAEAEASAWGSGWPLFAQVKAGRRGLLLQPDAMEGEAIFRTPFPRAQKAEFPPGRGNYVRAGKVVRVQLPLA